MKSTHLLIVVLVAVLTSAISMRVVSQDAAAPAAADEGELGSLTPLRGLDVAVRSLGETDFSEKTTRVAVEAYRDEDFGTLTYVTKTGAIAAMPQPNNFEIRILPFERYYEAIRFSPIAGAAWRLNLRTATWQLIRETGDLTPGDYEIEMFHISDTTMVIMRIDQLTGQTWTMTDDKWVEVKEPKVEN